MSKTFVTFTEEMIMNEYLQGWRGGRFEERVEGYQYSVNEFRVLTDRLKLFRLFCDRFDFKEYNKVGLFLFKIVVKLLFLQYEKADKKMKDGWS